jgi:3-hydroxyisobutyrate dehydrogenase-like beta-hydroxyacid dehydrogenase
MDKTLSLIGFGEAGLSFARAAGWGTSAHIFDIADKRADCEAAGVTRCLSLADALSASRVILCLVTADNALAVAEDAAKHLSPGALFFDMNSVAPDTKRAAAQAIEAAGGRYLDVAIMAPVNPSRLNVSLMLAGPNAVEGRETLVALGFRNVRCVGEDVGRASMVKMIRSVMIKGQEALTAEMMLAAGRAGVTQEVLASLGQGWTERAAYNLERMQTHGARRAAEMEQAALTLTSLGVEPLMTKGTIQRQREMAA